MNEIQLLKISYDRIIDTQEIALNDSNYTQYGYLKDDKGYYIYDNDLEQNIYFTHHDVDIKQTYTHILPNPSKFTPTYSDVDKEGSGRNEATGLMVRERIGHYFNIDVQWNLIPNSKERINLVRILRNLPPKFNLEYYDSDNDSTTTTIKEFYRADISEDLYVFTKDRQIWRGLATSFIQFNVDEYSDEQEPSYLPLTIRRFNNQSKKYEELTVEKDLAYNYLISNEGWSIVND